MTEHVWDCERCGTHMRASDEATLAWGVESHVCFGAIVARPGQKLRTFLSSLRGEEADVAEEAAVRVLIGLYGRPFVWFRAVPGATPLMVS